MYLLTELFSLLIKVENHDVKGKADAKFKDIKKVRMIF